MSGHAAGQVPAMKRLWVRAVAAPAACMVWLLALTVVGAAALETGHPAVGGPVLVLDALSVFAAILVLPAWVVQPVTGPPPDGRPPRGGITPLPLRILGDADEGADEDTGEDTDSRAAA